MVKPVVEVYFKHGFVELCGEAAYPGLEFLLPIAQCQCRAIKTGLGRCSQRGVITLELVEVAVVSDGNFRSLLIQTAKV